MPVEAVRAQVIDPTTLSGDRIGVPPSLNMLSVGIPLNIVLALFNLIPVPPLDGSHVLASLLPKRLADAYRQVGFFGILVLLVAMRWEPFQAAFSMVRSWLQLPYDLLIQFLV